MNTRLILISVLLSVACQDDTDKSEALQDSAEIAEDTAQTPIEDDENTPDPDTDTNADTAPNDGELWDGVCDLIVADKPTHVLPAAETEAPQLIILPESGESYLLTKESTADGWFMLEVPSWMCDVEMYTSEGVQIELEASNDYQIGAVEEPYMECDGTNVLRHSWTFHAWGSYVVHIQAADTAEFWLATRLLEQ